MHKEDEEKLVEQVFDELNRLGGSWTAEATALLARLPAVSQARELLLGRVRDGSAPWLEPFVRSVLSDRQPSIPEEQAAPAPPPSYTESLPATLTSGELYQRKVTALLAALRNNDPELASVVRKHLPGETDPFVLATMASVLGRRGNADDGPLLHSLLDHADQRVVANALESLRRLRVPVSGEEVARLLESGDGRVRTNAIALLSSVDVMKAHELLEALAGSAEAPQRAGVAHLLGELVEYPRALELLLSMIAREEQTSVLKQLAQSIEKHTVPQNSASIIGPVYSLRKAATGAKRSILDALLYEIATECGLVETDVRKIGEEYLSAKPTPAVLVPAVPLAPPAPPIPPVIPVLPVSPVSPAPPVFVSSPGSPISEPTTCPVLAEEIPASPMTGRKDEREEHPVLSVESPLEATAPEILPEGLSQPVRRWPIVAGGVLAVCLVVGTVARGLLGAVHRVEPSTSAQSDQRGVHPLPAVDPSPTSGSTSPRRAVAESAGASVQPASPARKELETLFGPMGARVSIKGPVIGVSFGRPVIECQGRYYVVVRGAGARDASRGDVVRTTGKLIGCSEDSIFYVEGEVR